MLTWLKSQLNLGRLRPSTLQPMPIIVGAPRSGTTLLRFMLDAHPELAIPPETGFLTLASSFKDKKEGLYDEFVRAITTYPPQAPAWQDFGIAEAELREQIVRLRPFSVADGFRTFYRMYAARFGKVRWGDKTPMYALHIRSIGELLPEAHFLHIVRDGRDVALSLRQVWFRPGDEMRTLANQWRQFVSQAREQGQDACRYLEIRYEALVREPEAELHRICDFLQLPFHSDMLTYHSRAAQRLEEHKTRVWQDGSRVVSHEQRLHHQKRTTQPPDESRIDVWKTEMTSEERREFESVAGETLRAFGFDLDREG